MLPERYVYHVTTKDKRDSILKEGLIPKASEHSSWGFKNDEDQYPPMVFANNTEFIHDFFYLLEGGYVDEKFDVWKIDTELFDGNWYADLNLNGLRDYVCTPEKIPIEVLTLMHFAHGVCSRCGCVDSGKTASLVFEPGAPVSVVRSGIVYPCCFEEIYMEEVCHIYYPIQEFVERYGRYRC